MAEAPETPGDLFGDRSADYDRYRPNYPAAAIAAILRGLEPPIAVADLGAGTGIGSRLLAQAGARIIAVEPNAAMRALAAQPPQITAIAGTAEAIPLPDNSVDLVAAFQAFHWFDFDRSLQECRRILKPGGRLALVWSFWAGGDRATRDYSRLVLASAPRPYSIFGPRRPPLDALRYQLFWQGWHLPGFANLRRQTFTSHQVLDRAGLLGLARSQGFTPLAGEAGDRLAAQVADFHRQFRDERDQVTLHYQTLLYTAISSKQGASA